MSFPLGFLSTTFCTVSLPTVNAVAPNPGPSAAINHTHCCALGRRMLSVSLGLVMQIYVSASPRNAGESSEREAGRQSCVSIQELSSCL